MCACLTNMAHMLIYFSYLTNQENRFDQFFKYSNSSLWSALPKESNKNLLKYHQGDLVTCLSK